MRTPFRIFKGRYTTQVGPDGEPAIRNMWYVEPSDYYSDLLWSPPYATREEAENAFPALLASANAMPPAPAFDDHGYDPLSDLDDDSPTDRALCEDAF